MKIDFAELSVPEDGALCVLAGKDMKLSATATACDQAMDGAITRAAKTSRFEGKFGTRLEIIAPQNLKVSRLVVLGTGDAAELSPLKVEKAAGTLIAGLLASGEEALSLAADLPEGCDMAAADFAAHLAAGIRQRSYRFDKYRTKEPKSKKPSLTSAVVLSADAAGAAAGYKILDAVLDGVFLTRDLVSEPANVLYPESFADIIATLKDDGVDVEILGEAELEKIGMNALLGVGQGSDRESKVAIMRWSGDPDAEDQTPMAFVGKGVTFDTGGISIKPSEGMEEMKWDMGGAGMIVGAMKALARRKAKANVIAVVGLVENMPSAKAQRPGDVVTSLSGQTIEVINTDAEGRLVLADILWYCQDRFSPKAMIDAATLTGAMLVTFGKGADAYAGLFTDSDELSAQLTEAGEATGDSVWRQPLGEAYDRMVDSQIADMRNSCGRMAGSITAAQFLKRHTNKVPWVHLDVAAVVWAGKDGQLAEKGATGYGVRLLDRFIADNYEA